MKDSPTDYKTVHRTVLYPPVGRAGLSSPTNDYQKEDTPAGYPLFGAADWDRFAYLSDGQILR